MSEFFHTSTQSKSGRQRQKGENMERRMSERGRGQPVPRIFGPIFPPSDEVYFSNLDCDWTWFELEMGI